jgi:hypothetical protein
LWLADDPVRWVRPATWRGWIADLRAQPLPLERFRSFLGLSG